MIDVLVWARDVAAFLFSTCLLVLVFIVGVDLWQFWKEGETVTDVRTDWPYDVPAPGEGQVRACPTCGMVLVFNCYHDGDDVSAEVMPIEKAKELRRRTRQMLFSRAAEYDDEF